MWLTPSERRPAGIATNGLPVGVQIVGPYLYDRTVIAFAWHRLPHRRIHAAAGIRGRDSLTVVPADRIAGGLVISRLAVVDDQGTAILEQISSLLHEAGETHHRVFRIVDGADDDWASWYADWLINLSELPALLGVKPVRSELTYLLVSLDKEYTATQPSEPWERYYAQKILAHFGPQRR